MPPLLITPLLLMTHYHTPLLPYYFIDAADDISPFTLMILIIDAIPLISILRH
jgi:hypothetical protein